MFDELLSVSTRPALPLRASRATREGMESELRQFLAECSEGIRSHYRWRFRKFSQYLGMPSNDPASALLKLSQMSPSEAKARVIGYLPWVRSFHAHKGRSRRKSGISAFAARLERRGLLSLGLRHYREERQRESWRRCGRGYCRVVRKWLVMQSQMPYKPESLLTQRAHLLRFGLFLGGKGLTLKRFGYPHLVEWIDQMREEPMGPSTINGILSTARRFCRWLFRAGNISGYPFEGIGALHTPLPLPPCLPRPQMGKLAAATRSTRNLALLLLLYTTGCRTKEVLGLNLDDVSLRHRTIRFRSSGETREVPLGNEAYGAIRALFLERDIYRKQRDSSPLFLGHNGARLRPPALRRMLSGLGAQVRTDHPVTPSVIRSTFSVHFLSNGGDPMTLKTVMGLTTLTAAISHSRLVTNHVRQVYERTHPRK
jgi:site-specific recombinase XerD